MNEAKSKIKKYILKEVCIVRIPQNPHKLISFSNLSKKVDLLFWFLDFKIEEPSWVQVADQIAEIFYQQADISSDSNFEELDHSLECLTANFLPFLKKIGYLKYKDTIYWSGDTKSGGIKNSSLPAIYSGVLDKRVHKDQTFSRLRLPEPIIQYYGIRQSILDTFTGTGTSSAQSELKCTYSELIQYFNLALGCYVMAIEDNYDFLYKILSPEYQYLHGIFETQNYITLSTQYVELFCEKITDYAVNEDQVIKPYEVSDNGDSEQTEHSASEDDALIDTVSNLFQKEHNFTVLGNAGSGKSTTLHYLFYQYSAGLYKEGSTLNQIPIFIIANEFSSENTFISMIELKLWNLGLQDALPEKRLVFFIDGINEIDENIKPIAYKELYNLIHQYAQCRFIISTRNHDFINTIEIPSYKLQPLREHQVYEFLKKNAINEFDKLYRQILENRSLVELAHSPLILQIIVAVSKSGKMPQSKGQLYDAFIKAILNREKGKVQQINTQEKFEILSQIAIWLKQNNRISSSMEDFILVLTGYFKTYCLTSNPLLFINELQDNLILQITADQSVFFYHESYLDYFSAQALLITFKEQRQLSSDFLTEQWYTPLIFCSELCHAENIAEAFSEFLFTGGISPKLQKPLSAFNSEDFNDHLLIACKVAYNIRFINPESYVVAEKYLNNTLILWLSFFTHKKLEIIPVELLFGAIAALNSELLITKLLYDERWVSLWLYDSKYEKNVIDLNDEINSFSLIPKFELIIQEFVKHTPNFSLTYRLITQRNQLVETALLTSVRRNIAIFKSHLLKNEPVRSIINYFKEEPRYDLLQYIMKKDLDYLADNFQTILASDIVLDKNFYFSILKYHPSRTKAYELVFSQLPLLDEREDEVTKIVDFSIFHNEASEYLMKYLDKLMVRKNTLFRNLLMFIKKISWSSLSVNLQNYFQSKLPHGKTVKYSVDYIDMDSHTAILTVDSSYETILQNQLNKPIRFNRHTESQILKIYTRPAPQDCHVMFFELPFKRTSDNIQTQGELVYYKNQIEYSFSYSNFEQSKTGVSLKFYLDKTLYPESYHFPRIRIRGKFYCNFTPLLYLNRSKENSKGKTIEFKVKISGIENEDTIPNVGEFECVEDFEIKLGNCKGGLLHPEQLINTPFLDELTRNFENEKVLNFISRAGIRYLFADKLKVRLGIIRSIYQNYAIVFCFDSQSFLEIPIPIGKEFSNEEIVIIEINQCLYKPIVTIDEKLLFKQGFIVSVDETRQEGFIRNQDFETDYFFSFKSCDFHPNTCDKVKFIVIHNNSPQYNGFQIAVKISKDVGNLNSCVIITSNINRETDSVYGLAKDIETEQLFKFSLSMKACTKIQNLMGIPLKGKYFTYISSKKNPEVHEIPKIELLLFTGDEN